MGSFTYTTSSRTAVDVIILINKLPTSFTPTYGLSCMFAYGGCCRGHILRASLLVGALRSRHSVLAAAVSDRQNRTLCTSSKNNRQVPFLPSSEKALVSEWSLSGGYRRHMGFQTVSGLSGHTLIK